MSKSSSHYISAFIISILLTSCSTKPGVYDIVIYGGTSAGVTSAVQAARMDKTVIIIEPGNRLGGLTSGGLGQTDIGNKHVIGGISREFYTRIAQKYSNPQLWRWQRKEEYISGGQSKTNENEGTMWTFEPRIALEVFHDLIEENNIPVIYNEPLDLSKGVIKRGARIQCIILKSGKKINGKVFIDATYEGDLMALSGVSYIVGRESISRYGETLNGVQKELGKYHQFPEGIDPFVIKGDSTSGLLPNINTTPGDEGNGDFKVQAYCYRMCLTDVPGNRVSVKKPEQYDEQEYELLFRAIEAGYKGPFFIMSDMPNNKTDSNNKGPVSSDYIGCNYQYPEGDYETREAIAEAHEIYQKGLLWTLSNHPRIPQETREYFSKWGLPLDEFEDTGHWPSQLYIREARRMLGDFVMTQGNCTLESVAEQSIGMGAYGMDSHHVQRYIDENGYVKNEGDVEVPVSAPYPVSYRAIVPKVSECTNLLVPVCLSASHIAYGSIRMEPVFMILGQSASIAACMAIDKNCNIQDLLYEELKVKLLGNGQILHI